MAMLQSPPADAGQLEQENKIAIAALKACGAVLPEGFRCRGIPQVTLSDAVQPDDVPTFDVAPYEGRLVFGGNMNSSDTAAYPSGPVRITIVRWGAGEDQCGRIKVGKTDLEGTTIVSYVGVTIGDHVTFCPRVVIMDCDGHPADRTLRDVEENKRMGPVVIEDYAWIGYGAVIMKGVTVGHHSVVAPGAVVMWDVPPYGKVVGSPAKSVKVFSRHMEKHS